MEALPFMNLPDEFCQLLRVNMQGGKETFKKIDLFIQNQSSLQSLINIHFQDMDKQGRASVIVKALGWAGLRDRLAVIYLSYKEEGDFSKKNNLLCSELLVFEDRLKRFSVNGPSRTFLLAFYLKMMALTPGTPFYGKPLTQIIPTEVLRLLGTRRAKVIPLDWLVLCVWHFHSFFGQEILEKSLDKKVEFEKIMEFLSKDQRELMFRNLLSYGASVRDFDFFMPMSA